MAGMVDIQGEWTVRACGIGRIFNLAGDRKIIKGIDGFNLAGGIEWGFFRVEIDLEYSDGFVLNYGQPGNGWLMRKVRDRIRPVGNDWEGTFYLGSPVFKFKLIRHRK